MTSTKKTTRRKTGKSARRKTQVAKPPKPKGWAPNPTILVSNPPATSNTGTVSRSSTIAPLAGTTGSMYGVSSVKLNGHPIDWKWSVRVDNADEGKVALVGTPPPVGSADKRTFPSGYQRDNNEGKGCYDLLPFESIHALARLFQDGAAKYGRANWRKGAPLSTYADCMLRHGFKAAAGIADEKHSHFIATAWNALCAYATLEMIKSGKLPKELDDVYAH